MNQKPTSKGSKGNANASNPSNPTKASRDQLRAQTPRVTAPRQSARPVERSNQKRAHSS